MTADDFIACRPQLDFIRGYREKYNALPTHSILKASFQDWAGTAEGEFGYWLDEMARLTVARKAQLAIQRALESGLGAGSIAALANDLGAIRQFGATNIVSADGGIALSLEKYLLRKEHFEGSGGTHVFGIRTSFDVINATNVGWMGGELVGFLARPTVGKTWMLINEAVTAWLQGYRVLFISPEMPASQINLRIYAMMSYRLGIHFSHRMAYAGNPMLEPAYRALVEQVGKSERWWTVDTVDDRTVGLNDLPRLKQQHSPDIIAIDGISLLYNETRLQESWQEMKYNAYGLKRFATAHNIPILVSHQSVNAKKGQRDRDTGQASMGAEGRGDDWRMPTLNDGADGESFVRALSTLITMAPDQLRRDLRWYSFRKVRERDMPDFHPRLALYWNVDQGQIDDLGRYGLDINQIMMEVKRLSA